MARSTLVSKTSVALLVELLRTSIWGFGSPFLHSWRTYCVYLSVPMFFCMASPPAHVDYGILARRSRGTHCRSLWLALVLGPPPQIPPRCAAIPSRQNHVGDLHRGGIATRQRGRYTQTSTICMPCYSERQGWLGGRRFIWRSRLLRPMDKCSPMGL